MSRATSPPSNDDVAYTHFEALKQYAASYMQAQPANNRQSSQRASAREKLTRLTRQQFEELCTNVYDEMRRRAYNSHDMPFLPVKPEYHPKRNQARQKLATLQVSRFKDLAVDVYLEIERRFPAVTATYMRKWGPDPPRGEYRQIDAPRAEYMGSPAPPLEERRDEDIMSPKSARRDDEMMSPKSARVDPRRNEEDLMSPKNGWNGPGYKSPVRDERPPNSPKTANLDGLLADLGELMTEEADEKDEKIKELELKVVNADRRLADAARLWDENQLLRNQMSRLEDENQQIRNALDKQSAELGRGNDSQKRVLQLESELTSVQQNSALQLQEMETKLTQVQQRNAQLEQELERLQIIEEDYMKLKEAYDSLERDFKGVQEDYNSQSQMINAIRSEATNILEEHKALERKNEELKSERERLLQQIQDLERANNDSGSGRTSDRSRSMARTNDRIEREYESVIGRQRMTAYNNAVEDLLRSAKSDAPTSVLVAMKSIVIACKEITETTERYESSLSLRQEAKDRLSSIKTKLSSSLASLMGAAKNHATNQSAVQQLEIHAKGLTGTINDLLRVLRKADRDPDSRSRERGVSRERMDRERMDRDREERDRQYPPREDNVMDIDELRIYLEKQTDLMVQGIQSLLLSMKQQSVLGPEFAQTVNSITQLVDNLVRVSRRALSRTDRWQGAEEILQDLSGSNLKLGELGMRMNSGVAHSKQDKQRLATCSSEIAKRVKDLVSLLD